MLVRNFEDKELVLMYGGVNYTFPSCPDKAEKIVVVEVGEADVASWFCHRTYKPPNMKTKTPATMTLREFKPKADEKVEVAAVYFPVEVRPPEKPLPGTALNSFATRRENDAPVKPDPEKVERQRREMIATLPAGLLRQEVERRKLADRKDKLDRQKMVDMLIATDFVPPAV